MIDAMMNLLFGCRHHNMTRPITPVRKASVTASCTYVVCLDCGQQFHYDTTQMCMGKQRVTASASTGSVRFQESVR